VDLPNQEKREAVLDKTILLYLLTLESPKNFGLPDQYFYESPFSSKMRFGKYCALFKFGSRHQYLVYFLFSLSGQNRDSEMIPRADFP
jgi:hypothetical protein